MKHCLWLTVICSALVALILCGGISPGLASTSSGIESPHFSAAPTLTHPTFPLSTPLTATPMVAAGGYYTVGLKSDGTVVAVGYNYYGQCNISGWTGIVQVSAGGDHTVGLKSDGTVVAMGLNNWDELNVSG